MITNLVAYSLINGGGTPQPSQPDVSDWVTSAEMPSGTTAIPDDAFNGFRNLRNVQLNNELSEIGARAFYNCENLDVIIEDGLTIGENAFYGCSNVSMVTDTKPSYELDANEKFYGCDNITIIIPSGTTVVAEEAFKGCDVITELITPNTLTEIGRKAFMDCVHLKKATITLNETINEFSIQVGAFSQCYELEEIELPSNLKKLNAYTFLKNTNLTNINIPNAVTKMETGVFSECSSLTGITLPNRLEYMRNRVFERCTNLATINIPSSLTQVDSTTFLACSSLETVTLESGFNANGLDLSASTLYSVNTLVTMLNALSDRTGLEAYTLVLGSTNLAKLSNEQIAIATQKNWTLA